MKRLHKMPAFWILIAAAALYAPLVVPYWKPTWDSGTYITLAQSLAEGKGLLLPGRSACEVPAWVSAAVDANSVSFWEKLSAHARAYRGVRCRVGCGGVFSDTQTRLFRVRACGSLYDRRQLRHVF